MASESSVDTLRIAPADPGLPGPFPVGQWATGFRNFLRTRPRVLLIGEVTNFKRARANAYFELRDADGAVPCSIWTSDLDKLRLPDGALRDGAEVIVAGGPDFYPGTATASPGFSFRVTYLRLAGEGDLLARLAALRKQLEADGLFTPQKALPRPAIPRTIGVVTARNSAACADLLAGLERRGWRGTIVWADTPVQDRRAAGAIATALRNLAALPQVDVAVVCRGGGSLTDLWAFCDETLCRTVALLRLPVVSAVGHESDRTLIDDVSAVCCSTPTHAANALVQVDVNTARTDLRSFASLAARTASTAIGSRGRRLAELAGGPKRSVRLERRRLHQLLREVRASATRGQSTRTSLASRHALVLSRKQEAFERRTAPPAASSCASGEPSAAEWSPPSRRNHSGSTPSRSRSAPTTPTAPSLAATRSSPPKTVIRSPRPPLRASVTALSSASPTILCRRA